MPGCCALQGSADDSKEFARTSHGREVAPGEPILDGGALVRSTVRRHHRVPHHVLPAPKQTVSVQKFRDNGMKFCKGAAYDPAYGLGGRV